MPSGSSSYSCGSSKGSSLSSDIGEDGDRHQRTPTVKLPWHVDASCHKFYFSVVRTLHPSQRPPKGNSALQGSETTTAHSCRVGMVLLLQLACGIIPASEEALGRDHSLSSATTTWADEAGRAQSWVNPDCGADCVSKCHSVKHHFPLSITERTGRSMPYWRRHTSEELHSGASLSSPDAFVTTGVIVMAGLERSASDYVCATHDGLRKRLVTAEAIREVLLVAPAVLFPGDPPTPNELYWEEAGRWLDGENSSLSGHHDIAAPAASLSLFSVLDEMVSAMMDKDSYPKLTSVIVIGHSAGAQAVQRYALTSALVPTRAGVTISYIVANPGSVTYPDERRPDLIDRGNACDPVKLLVLHE